jgi:nucleotide-binding universal stress UspA family protein
VVFSLGFTAVTLVVTMILSLPKIPPKGTTPGGRLPGRGEMMVHLLNVQPPFSAYVARHVHRAVRADFQRERAGQALAGARALLDSAGVPGCLHAEVGDKAVCIVGAAVRLRCDRILMGTSRKSALARAVGNSLTGQLLESAPVPVEVICGSPAGALERVAIPAGVGAGMAWLLIGGG